MSMTNPEEEVGKGAMNTDELTVSVRGPEASGGGVDASVYARFLQDFLTCVRRIESRVRDDGAEPVRFQIARMHASAPTLSLKAVSPQPEQGSRVVSAYMRAVNELEHEGSHPPYVDVPTLHSFRKLGRYVGDGLSAINFSAGGVDVHVTKRLTHAVERVLGMVIKAQGSFSGRLEYINAHGGYRCRIYPRSGPNYVECRFPPELLPEVASGLKRHVTVTGTLHYYGFQAFPHRIDASDIAVHPSDSELPTIWDLWGLAPEVTGEDTVEDFVRGLREPHD